MQRWSLRILYVAEIACHALVQGLNLRRPKRRLPQFSYMSPKTSSRIERTCLCSWRSCFVVGLRYLRSRAESAAGVPSHTAAPVPVGDNADSARSVFEQAQRSLKAPQPPAHRSSGKVNSKVLDFVQFGGPNTRFGSAR